MDSSRRTLGAASPGRLPHVPERSFPREHPAGERPGGRIVPSAEPGVSLRLWDWGGDGPPVLLLHGFGMSARVWDPIAGALATHRVLAPDARGHGDSDRSPDPHGSSRTGLADLTALVDELALERFALVGHSMGAAVSIRFAARHPERLERLVLLDAGPDLPAVSRRRPRPQPRRTPPVSGFASVGAYAQALGILYPRARPEELLELAHHWLTRRPDGRFEPKLDPGLLRPENHGAEPSAVARRKDSDLLWSQLARIRCPILIVRGAHSTVLSEPTARRMLAVAEDAQLVELAQAGHAVMLDAPRALAAALQGFLT